MGAISKVQSIPTLKELLNDESKKKRKRARLRLQRLSEWDNLEEGKAERTNSQEENP